MDSLFLQKHKLMLALEKYHKEIQYYFSTLPIDSEPKTLYTPINYILSLGGKKIRPVLTLISYQFFKKDYKKAIPAAMALELFHNFSLIHDDIMDQAPLRRGQKTVHEKWDLNTGILSGDALLILAYQLFEQYPATIFRELAKLFSKTALKVCEGQQYDIDFETQTTVSISQYLKMIEYKTAVLLGAAMQMGAIVAEASQKDQKKCYDFGKNLGIAFQLQDDYLDAFGNPKTFGKQVGGDIIANKKTFLYLYASKKTTNAETLELNTLFSENPENPNQKIKRVKELFVKTGASKAIVSEINKFTQLANQTLDEILVSKEDKETLKQFAKNLMTRKV